MKRYGQLLRVPHVAALVTATLVSRFPIGINALAVVLFLRNQTGSFAVAGATAGALAGGSALGAPLSGRLIDRTGAGVLLPIAVVHAVFLGLLVLEGRTGAHPALLVTAGLIAGSSLPPTSSVQRLLWPSLLRGRPELQQAAYALDSVSIELLFIAGPLLTGLIAAVAAPEWALAVSAVAVVLGTLLFVAQPPVGEIRGRPDGEGGGPIAGALRSPGVLTLVLTSVPAGVGLGICEVAVPAFSDAHGAAERAGLLLAVWSGGSAIGGIVYGAMRRPPLQRVHIAVSVLLPLGILPLAVAPSMGAMALLIIPAGLFIAPLLATRNELIGRVAPADARTEAYTWPQTAFVGGISIGAAMAGAIVEGSGATHAFLAASAIAAVGAVIAVARRHTVRAASYPV